MGKRNPKMVKRYPKNGNLQPEKWENATQKMEKCNLRNGKMQPKKWENATQKMGKCNLKNEIKTNLLYSISWKK